MFDVIIIGAGAAGLMCAIQAGRKGLKVALLDHSARPGAKILISGGGRCNFTNLDVSAENYISANPHFAKSALSRFTPDDIMAMLAEGGASWHEKTLGQLFCNEGAKKVLSILLDAAKNANVALKTSCLVQSLSRKGGDYILQTSQGALQAKQLVIATGGLSIPKMGATDFAYRVAKQFDIPVITPEPALVPFVFEGSIVSGMKQMAGVAVHSRVSCGKTSFTENLLFTHRGVSGPAILQISSYWTDDTPIKINVLPNIEDIEAWLISEKVAQPKAGLKSILAKELPERLAVYMARGFDGNMADFSHRRLSELAKKLSTWSLVPTGTEGFKKAEVTRGGVCTSALNSRTMECKAQSGLYFIGECVDVTGWLGGYNFQWAWASGNAAAEAMAAWG